MTLRRTPTLFVALLLSSGTAVGVGPDDARGSPTHMTQVQGPGGDSVSAYSGNLELAVPIGPSWELPGMSWGLTLRYSSNIWRLWTDPNTGVVPPGTLARRGPFGVGWLLTMGRVFRSCRDRCEPREPLLFEDAQGTLHPIVLDKDAVAPGAPAGAVVPGETIDGTYMRVEAVLARPAPADPNSLTVDSDQIASFRIYPGNGVVMSFETHPADEASHPLAEGHPDDFYGWLLTKVEKRGPDPTVVESRVEVGYDAARPHCMLQIRDYLGSSTTPFRTVNFTNASTHADGSGALKSVEGGFTTAVTMPAAGGRTGAAPSRALRGASRPP
jgi:hypothetical protein